MKKAAATAALGEAGRVTKLEKISFGGKASAVHLFLDGHFYECLSCEYQKRADEAIEPADRLADVGQQKQLFWDDFIISSVNNIERKIGNMERVHRPSAAGPDRVLLQRDQSWESNYFGFYGSVLVQDRKWRMWYMAYSQGVGYAESDDGITWRKPSLMGKRSKHQFAPRAIHLKNRFEQGVLPVPEHSNIVGSFGVSGFTPARLNRSGLYSTGYACRSIRDEVFVWALRNGLNPDLERTFITKWQDVCAASSPDGLYWNQINGSGGATSGSPGITLGPGDCSVLTHDLTGRRGISLVTRFNFPVSRPDGTGFRWRGARGVRFLHTNSSKPEASDQWHRETLFYLDAEYGLDENYRRQVYSLGISKHEGIYVGLFTVLEWPKGGIPGTNTSRSTTPDTTRIYWGTSRDGLHFDLRWIYAGKQLVPVDETLDESNHQSLRAATQIVTTEKHHWVYFESCTEPHETRWKGGCTIQAGRFRRDGMAYLTSRVAGQWGRLVTRPFIVNGTQLLVDFQPLTDNAQLRVAVLDADAAPIHNLDCGSSTSRPIGVAGVVEVQWQGSRGLQQVEGKVVKLAFYILESKIFSFQIKYQK